MVELVGPDAPHRAQCAEDDRRRRAEIDHRPEVHHVQARQALHIHLAKRHQPDQRAGEMDPQRRDRAHHDPPRRRARNEARRQLQRREGRHEKVHLAALHLRDGQRGGGVLEGVLQDRHDDEARREEIVVDQPLEIPRQLPPVAKGELEHRHEEQRRDHRGEQGLHPHLQEARHLALEQRPGAEPVERAIAPGRAHQRGGWREGGGCVGRPCGRGYGVAHGAYIGPRAGIGHHKRKAPISSSPQETHHRILRAPHP